MKSHSPSPTPPQPLATTTLLPTLRICLFWTFGILESVLPICSHPALLFSIFPDTEALAGAERQPVPARGGVPEPREGPAHGARGRVRTKEKHHEGYTGGRGAVAKKGGAPEGRQNPPLSKKPSVRPRCRNDEVGTGPARAAGGGICPHGEEGQGDHHPAASAAGAAGAVH